MTTHTPVPPKTVQNFFGQYLRACRNAAGISQRTLADCIQVSHTYISKIESGDNGPPSKWTCERIATALGLPEQEVLAHAGKITVAQYQELLATAYTLLQHLKDPRASIDRRQLSQWLEQAARLLPERESEERGEE